MDGKALDALRNGLEDSYWYGDDDERVFNELVRKAEAFDEIKSIHLNMFGNTVRPISMEEAEDFGMSVMRVLTIGEDK